MKVDIIDIGSGNVGSVRNWIESANVATRIVSRSLDIASEIVVLPGVGSAGSYMHRLRLGRFDEAIKNHLKSGRRLVGICLGFQVMMQYSEEDGHTECLGILDGYVERLCNNSSHNGWEPISFSTSDMVGQSFGSKLSLTRKRLFKGRVFYNHEYGVVNSHANVFSLPVNNDLARYSGLLVKDNIIGIQFHPEKSQISGVELLKLML